MTSIISNSSNLLEVRKGHKNKLFYLSKNIWCKYKKLKLIDCFKLRKIILGCTSEFKGDLSMLFHYKIIFDSQLYLIVYSIKQQFEDRTVSTEKEVFPIQFLINEIYGKNKWRSDVLCIAYKIKSSIYLIYSRKRTIIYCRLIDEDVISNIEIVIKEDMNIINENLKKNFNFGIVSNISCLRESKYILKYLEDSIDALSI